MRDHFAVGSHQLQGQIQQCYGIVRRTLHAATAVYEQRVVHKFKRVEPLLHFDLNYTL